MVYRINDQSDSDQNLKFCEPIEINIVNDKYLSLPYLVQILTQEENNEQKAMNMLKKIFNEAPTKFRINDEDEGWVHYPVCQ
ncbi:MAG: hypothetical protein H7839_23515 [Magnetococcus sp. YQC-5]